MIRRSVLLAFVFFLPWVAQAGPRVGNGGGVWVCESREEIRWLRFVDLFEAEMEFGYTLADSGTSDAWQILAQKRSQIREVAPALHAMMQRHPVDLAKVTRFLPDSTELTQIEDAFIRVRPLPETCAGGYLYYGQLANFTFDGRLLISSRFWSDPQFSEQERGALLVHEAVYKTLREEAGDEDSSRTREIVGILFSALPVEEQGQRINEVLAR